MTRSYVNMRGLRCRLVSYRAESADSSAGYKAQFMNGNFRWLVGAAVILILAYMAVSHDYNLAVGPGAVRLERSSHR